ncbi:MAG: glycosyltransferase N-terminal domain-containing protein [bacterium]
MYKLYTIALGILRLWAGIYSHFNSKLRRGIEGRKTLFTELEKYYHTFPPVERTLSPFDTTDGLRVRPTKKHSTIDSTRKRVLIHVSSFGELEQAKPVIAALKQNYPAIHIHLTFFSPSGYENSINKYSDVDFISYLPFDFPKQVNQFLDITKPDLILFARYDLWHNFVRIARERKIPMVLFSATFGGVSKRMLPFVRSLYKKAYSNMSAILTSNEKDYISLRRFLDDSPNVRAAGDTRVDQVLARRKITELDLVQLLPEELLRSLTSEGAQVIVAGSTWDSDEKVIILALIKSLQQHPNTFLVIAPHEPTETHVNNLLESFGSQAISLSSCGQYKDQHVIIVDSVGKLFEIYQYATFAYIGGGFGAGVHNVLEPAAWGAPSIVGPNHRRSHEINHLVENGGVKEIRNSVQLLDALHMWLDEREFLDQASKKVTDYIQSSKGATEEIMKVIEYYL